MPDNQPQERFLLLAQKWVEGSITEEELREYTDWLKEIDPDASIHVSPEQAASKEDHRKKIYESLQYRIKRDNNSQTKKLLRIYLQRAAILAALILLGYTTYLVTGDSPKQPAGEEIAATPVDIQPGTNGAILTLASGKVIILDTAANGALENNIMKSQETLVFESVSAGETVQYNTLSTPRARQQQLILPDGSRIWLNAESSIRFPTAFTGKTREVEITGEVYFEVMPDRFKPFKVNVQDASVVVLGTHFNVMAYPNEKNLEATLLEGAIRFENGSAQQLLKPGQQVKRSSGNQLELITNPDIELIMAWKNGFQSFKKADIRTILRQITRWYDVDVEFDVPIPDDISFTGEIPREVTLSQLLKALESKQLQFTLDAPNKKVRVQYQP